MRGNVITLSMTDGWSNRTGNLFQYDYGQRGKITGAELPEIYEVHVGNGEEGTCTTVIGGSTGFDIPDEYLQSGDDVHVWLYLHDGASDGETEYHWVIEVIPRGKPTDQEPTPVQQETLEVAIALLESTVEALQVSTRAEAAAIIAAYQ